MQRVGFAFMVILTHSDVMALSIGIAQLIPVFLIALFVIDNTWILKSIEQAKDDAAKAIGAIKKGSEESESQFKDFMESSLQEIDKYAAMFNDSENDPHIVEMRFNVIKKGAELKNKTWIRPIGSRTLLLA